MSTNGSNARLMRLVSTTHRFAKTGLLERALDGLLWLQARRLFQRSGLFAALPLTGLVLEVEGDRGHLAEAAVHHIPNRRCIVVDMHRGTKQLVDRRVRRRKFHRVCAPPHRLPFVDGAFDAVWTTFALARLDPATQELVLAEMHRVVRPGGVLIALERVPDPVGRRWHARIDELLMPSARPGARAYRSAKEWRVALADQGWHVEAENPFAGATNRLVCRAFVCRRP